MGGEEKNMRLEKEEEKNMRLEKKIKTKKKRCDCSIIKQFGNQIR